MKKIISLLMATLICFSFFSVGGFAADEAITAFSVGTIEDKDHGAQLCVEWYKGSDAMYLFVPESINLAEAKICYTADSDVYVDGVLLNEPYINNRTINNEGVSDW